jgi:transposase
MLGELFRLAISEGAIANTFRRMKSDFDTARTAIWEKLLTASVIATDETTTRVDGVTHWHWVLVSDQVVLRDIAPAGPGAWRPRC